MARRRHRAHAARPDRRRPHVGPQSAVTRADRAGGGPGHRTRSAVPSRPAGACAEGTGRRTGEGAGHARPHGDLRQAVDWSRRALARSVAETLQVGDRTSLQERQQPEQGPRSERGQEEERRPSQYGAESSSPVGACGTARGRAGTGGKCPGGEAEHGDDDELAEDQGDKGVNEASAPVGDRRPRQRGQGQRKEEHGHVDRGGAYQQLHPDHHRAEYQGDATEEDHEGWDPRLSRGSRAREGRRHRGHEVAGVQPRSVGDGRAHGVGHRQTELHELDRHRRQQDGQRDVEEHRAHQHRRVLPVDRLDDAEQQEGDDDHAGQRGHGLVVGGEPRRPEVDAGGGAQHVADLRQQPHRACRHPTAQCVENAADTETGQLGGGGCDRAGGAGRGLADWAESGRAECTGGRGARGTGHDRKGHGDQHVSGRPVRR